MIYVFLAGVFGFLVFDAYRARKVWEKTGAVVLTFGSFVGVLTHILVYVAAGILAVFINLDILIAVYDMALWPDFDDSILGSVVRGFGLGLAGPAGLSRGQIGPEAEDAAIGSDFGDLPSSSTYLQRIRAALKFILMR